MRSSTRLLIIMLTSRAAEFSRMSRRRRSQRDSLTNFRRKVELAGVLLTDWRERVAPLLTTVGSPRHFAYVNGSGAMIGILADTLAARYEHKCRGMETRSGRHRDRKAVSALDCRLHRLSH